MDRRRCDFALAPELVARSTELALRPETSSHAPFPTTRWSQVIAAGDRAGPAARDAPAELSSAYWYPLYAFVRRKGHPPGEATDPADVEDEVRAKFAALARGIRADSCDLGGDFPFSCVEDDDEGSSRTRGGLRLET